jgi:hypothetical protein
VAEPTIGSAAFTPQNELEMELVRAAHEPALQPGFLRDLLRAEVFLALTPADGRIPVGPDGQARLPPNERLELTPLEKDGRTLLPFFSAPARAAAHLRADHFIAPERVRDLFSRHPGTDFMLNPGSDYSVEITREDVERLLRGELGTH